MLIGWQDTRNPCKTAVLLKGRNSGATGYLNMVHGLNTCVVLLCLQEVRNAAQAEARELACELGQAQREIEILQTKLTAAEVRWLHAVMS
jgi:hypothetical protein